MANPDQPDSGDAVSGRTAIGRVMAALLVAAPAVVLRVTGTALPAPIAVVVFGAGDVPGAV